MSTLYLLHTHLQNVPEYRVCSNDLLLPCQPCLYVDAPTIKKNHCCLKT